jgi:threo-3-hydroxy-L-aspartate ammonia-lyase
MTSSGSSSASSSLGETTFSVSFDDIEQAAKRLEGHVHRTPLMRSQLLDAAVGASIFSKAEHLQRTGSFKIRGALNRMMQLTDSEKAAGVVAFSSGNHAQGVALAGRILGISTTIVMPIDAPEVKKTATRGYGATVVEYDRYSEDREVVAARVAGDRGCPIVPPFNDPRVIAGQGTVGLESAQDGPRFDIAVLPVGGGGLASGMALALKTLNPDIRIWGVEPAAADDARQSIAAGRIVSIDQPRTVADGVATQAVGSHTFPMLQQLLEGIVTVTEDEILSALGFVMTRMKQAVEPTGALTTAALMFGRIPDVGGAQILSVFCGGNLDLNVIGQIPR